MGNSSPNQTLKAVFTIMRLIVGWHFLYQGISKLMIPEWSSFSYLMESKWLLSGFFHWIATNPEVLKLVDLINIWGLILIGLLLMLGLFRRLASIGGIFLLLIYYIANPPFIESSYPSQGQYFIVNLNIIESGILLIFSILPDNYFWGLDHIIHINLKRKKEKIFPEIENRGTPETILTGRRELIKNLASIPVLGLAFFGFAKKYGWFSYEEEQVSSIDARTSATNLSARQVNLDQLEGQVPKGKIKHLDISRIIPGGNLVAGFAHARDLVYVSRLIKNYFTDEKVIETLWIYEACGINTTVMRTDENTVRILEKYWKRGGKIQWLAQTYPRDDDFSNIQLAIDHGAVGAFVMGGIADQLVFENRLDDLAKPIEFIRSNGLIAGTAGHAIQVPMTCVEKGIETDFFMKTFHHDQYWSTHPEENRQEFMHNIRYNRLERDKFNDNMWCPSAEVVSDFFKSCEIPWIAYKVLAAGSIHPSEGFQYAFEHGADFVCAGMFDFQIIENANFVHDIFSGSLKRTRKWYA
jgi:uncharacterized membrane protein YphA (DoxX/SURF4 family)